MRLSHQLPPSAPPFIACLFFSLLQFSSSDYSRKLAVSVVVFPSSPWSLCCIVGWVMHELSTFPFSFRNRCLSPITTSTSLHALAPACVLLRISVSVPPYPQTAPPKYTKLSRWLSFFPASLISRSFFLLPDPKHLRLL